MNADGGLALMVNGEVVSQSSFNGPSLAVANAGSVAGSNSGVAPIGAASTATMRAIPACTEVTFFEGQTTGHELSPLG
jgi:hypothetical protein